MSNSFHLLRFLLLASAALAFTTAAQAPGDTRVALVIGNGAYTGVSPLANPSNDAREMAQTLKGLGFTVIELHDASKSQMTKAIADARDALRGRQGVGMLYYAGHGLQIDSHNFMVPVDAMLRRATDVAPQTVDIGSVIDAFRAAGTRMNILVMDACRDNPFGGITTGKGLAPVDAPTGTFLAYATAPGNVAADGDVRTGNGLYTQSLLAELKKPQTRIEDVFKHVRFAVRQASSGRQIPWESTSLEEEFSFNEGRVTAQQKPDARLLADSFNEEKRHWDRIKDSRVPDDFYGFLRKYPDGTISEAALARINLLEHPAIQVQGAAGKYRPYVRSTFRLGDEFEEISNNNSLTLNSFSLIRRVTQIIGEKVEASVSTIVDGKVTGDPRKEVYNGSGGMIAGGFYRYDPPQYIFPSEVIGIGTKWKFGFEAISLRASLPNHTVSSEASVVGRETLRTKAGVFETLRVLHVASSSAQPGASTRCQVWMSEDLPVLIKSDCEMFRSDQPTYHYVSELVRIKRGI